MDAPLIPLRVEGAYFIAARTSPNSFAASAGSFFLHARSSDSISFQNVLYADSHACGGEEGARRVGRRREGGEREREHEREAGGERTGDADE